MSRSASLFSCMLNAYYHFFSCNSHANLGQYRPGQRWQAQAVLDGIYYPILSPVTLHQSLFQQTKHISKALTAICAVIALLPRILQFC